MSQKSVRKWVIITVVIIATATLAYQLFKPEEPTPNYITATAKMGDIENNVMASGKVKALNTVDVGSQVSGEVTKLYVDIGDEVKKGDLIAQIDQVTQQNNVANQQATLEQSHANLQSANADYISRQASLKGAYANLASRQAELRQALTEFQRLQPLMEINAISQQDLDNARTKVETAEAAVVNAQANIDTSQAAIATAAANIANNEAALRKTQTDLDTATEKLGHATIRAPMDGTVVSVTTKQGTTVNANQAAPTIVTLADLSKVRINAQISEADVTEVKAGMPVYFNTIGNPDKQYDAVLTAIEPAPEKISTSSATNSAIYYVGYIEVPNPERKFRIDMTAQVFIVINQAKNTLLIPSTALLDDKPTSRVRVLNKDGQVEEKSVRVGINNRVNAQILRGLQAGDKVILSEDTGNTGQPDFE